MELLAQIFVGVAVTVLGSVLTAVILHRLRLSPDHGPASIPSTSAPQATARAEDQSLENPVAEETPAERGRREETMKLLFRHGVITPGMEIEPMPQALPEGDGPANPDVFRVRIGIPPGREVIWLFENQTYSLSRLSNWLSDEYGLKWFRTRTFELWRIVGQEESLWDLAEGFVRRPGGAS